MSKYENLNEQESSKVISNDTDLVVEKIVGVVTNCVSLNVRKEPIIDDNVTCIVINSTEVLIDISKSTEEFYYVHLSSGIEGFCMKKHIDIRK